MIGNKLILFQTINCDEIYKRILRNVKVKHGLLLGAEEINPIAYSMGHRRILNPLQLIYT